jgi:hypothetical protein
LVQHSIKRNGGLAGLTISNDQFPLSSANRHHCVDGFETSLHWLVDGTAGENTGCFELSSASLGRLDGSLAINGVSEGIDNAPK